MMKLCIEGTEQGYNLGIILTHDSIPAIFTAHDLGMAHDYDSYWMCRALSDFMKEKRYSEIINVIGIVPIAAPASVIEKGLCKSHKKCEPRYGFASVSLQIDYEKYIKADSDSKKKLIIDNILESVKSVSKRGKINFGLFEEDVKIFCENNSIIL